MTTLNVAVAGGGIGGLTAALALRRAGAKVTVYEQAARLGEVGAGVTVTPNGWRLLERLGVGASLRAVSSRMDQGIRYFRHDGQSAASIRDTDHDPSHVSFAVHRADLLELLFHALPDGCVAFGHRVLNVTQDREKACLEFENGLRVEADAVVGADGTHSAVLPCVTTPTPAVYSGYVAYRGVLDATGLPGWVSGTTYLWMGDKKHFLAYPIRAGRLINYVGFVPREIPERQSWSSRGDVRQLAEEFSGWDPVVVDLIAQVSETFQWGLFDREPLGNWCKGRVTLLGDAAHPMLPHLAQGINQAIEDAVTVASRLAHARSDGVSEALLDYERARRDRTDEVQRLARVAGRLFAAPRDSNLAQRDAEVARGSAIRTWLYSHDAAPDFAKAGTH